MSQEDDKTRVQPSQAKPNDDATRLAARKPAAKKPPVQPRRTAPDDEATRFKARMRSAAAAHSAAATPGDVTRVVPQKRPASGQAGDATRFTPARKSATPRPTGANAGAKAQSASTSQARGETGGDIATLKNRFVFEEVLGTGGMGIVYKARDLLKVEAQDRDPYVAIKVLGEDFKAHPEAFIALQRESRKTQRIAHPNIVNVYDFDRDGDTVFMTMEYMEGKPLDKLLSQYRSTGLPPEDATKILEGISAALIYAHQQSIIHSDFKPGNIFVTNNGTAKVFDFGIARAVAKAEHREESLDDKTVFDAGTLGALTPAYASLEMLEGSTPDIRDDVYALGCIAYEMFTGEHPYNRVHADEALRQKIKPKRISGLSSNQWKAIEGAVALKRENRIESVDEFLRKFHQKKSRSFSIFMLVVLSISAAAGGVYSYWPEPPEPQGDVRGEIEQQLRIELRMQSITDMLASLSFSEEWEEQLWDDVQVLRESLGPNDEWLANTEQHIYQQYLHKISALIEEPELDFAERLIGNAPRYANETSELEQFTANIAAARAELERLEQERLRQQQVAQRQRQQAAKQAEVQAEEKTQFDRALATVEGQLDCRNNIDMGDFEIALNKLRSISTQKYADEKNRIMRLMGLCIARIGEYYPDRAEDTKKQALVLFDNHRSIAEVKIVPKDACNLSLAGLGASGMRATCRDLLRDNRRAPLLVVIPGTDEFLPFAISKYEVTAGEYNDYCEQAASCTQPIKGDAALPVTNISLAQVNAYLEWLSQQSGKSYRLPTLSEWHFAASSTDHAIDPNRNCKLQSRGISRGSSLLRANVGQQNPWGLVNHLGNAREWAVAGGGRTFTVGGAFESPMDECSLDSSAPHDGNPDHLTGFRLVREIASR